MFSKQQVAIFIKLIASTTILPLYMQIEVSFKGPVKNLGTLRLVQITSDIKRVLFSHADCSSEISPWAKEMGFFNVS